MPIKIAQLNTRSLIAHFLDVVSIIHNEEIDIFCITETWLTESISSEIVNIPGYHLYRSDRGNDQRRGGVAAYVSTRYNFNVVQIDCDKIANTEQLWLRLKLKRKTLALGVVYRTEGRVSSFIESMDDLLSNILPTVDDVILTGDMNIDLFKLDNPLSRCLDSYSFVQVIDEATRVTETSQTLIDPIFISDSDLIVSSGTRNADEVADHRLVFCNVNLDTVKSGPKVITVRDFKHLNLEHFDEDLFSLSWGELVYLPCVDDKVEYLSSLIRFLFDKHAPMKTIRVSKPKAPWLTDAVKIMMRERDRALSKYKRTKRDADWANYKKFRNSTLYAIRREKKAYCKSIFYKANIKDCWRGLRSMGIQTKKKV